MKAMGNMCSGNVASLAPPPNIHESDNYTRWGSRAEFYFHTVPLESRTVKFFRRLDYYVFDVIASLGLTHQTKSSVAIPSSKAEFDQVRNIGVAR